jgi:hypothetical protein
MNRNVFMLSLLAVVFTLTLFSCEKEVEVIVDPTQPSGAFTINKQGAFVAQNGTGSMGIASIGVDEDGEQFLRFNDAFTTNFATGTVTVYLSTSQNFTPDPANGNPALRLVGPVTMSGENFFKLTPVAGNQFTHVILWCGSANIPFGYAALQ